MKIERFKFPSFRVVVAASLHFSERYAAFLRSRDWGLYASANIFKRLEDVNFKTRWYGQN